MSRKLSEVTLESPRRSFLITSIKERLKFSIKAASVACGPTLENVGIPLPIKEIGGAYGLALEDATSRIPSFCVACGSALKDVGIPLSIKATGVAYGPALEDAWNSTSH
jgi:hypothetical protein